MAPVHIFGEAHDIVARAGDGRSGSGGGAAVGSSDSSSNINLSTAAPVIATVLFIVLLVAAVGIYRMHQRARERKQAPRDWYGPLIEHDLNKDLQRP